MKGLTYKKCILYTFIAILTLCFPQTGKAQLHFYPPFWYAGMENDTLEVLVYSEGDPITSLDLDTPGGIVLLERTPFKNPRYASFTLFIGGERPATLRIQVNGETHNYLFKERQKREVARFSQADVMYLITPDRFANGNLENDSLPGFAEKKYGRSKPFGRHGGDIEGIKAHLDYIKDLGASSIWISPLLENNQADESYHGYAITDHYRIDPRMGSNKAYQVLIRTAHKKQMKVIKDMVYNHVGTGHFLYRDMPDSSFFNLHKGKPDGYKQTSYRATTVTDPHRSREDYETFQDGWFVAHMPDLNQRNPHVARFLIQNSIWWIETFGVDAFRIDTYIYPDQAFMARLSKQVKKQYPGFFIFGETWVHGQPIQSYFVEQMRYNPLNTYLDAVTDFQMYYAFNDAVHNKQSWTGGVSKIYYTLAADYLYNAPEKLVTFLDNHDLARFAGNVQMDLKKLRLGYNWLFTMRGIPCLYYGSELGMHQTKNHGLLREDFPGGWPEDEQNAFTPEGRTPIQDSIFSYLRNLLQWRATSQAVAKGKLTQFVPEKGVYVYFRHSAQDTVMVIANTADTAVTHSLKRYRELWPLHASGTDVLSGEDIRSHEVLLPAMSSRIIQLKK